VQADLQTNSVELTANLGPVLSQFNHAWSHDNLAALDSVLTTQTRNSVWTTTIPIDQLAGTADGPERRLPSISYTLNRVHQFGDGLPVGADFDSLSQVPDQVSLNQSIGALWQSARWRAGYQYNRSLQDNRQLGRELADLLNLTNTASVGFMAPPRADIGFEFAWEGAENRELADTDLTRRWSITANAQPAARTAIAGTVSRTFGRNQGLTRERRNTDFNLQVSQTVALVPQNPNALQGQLFVRFARQSLFSFERLFGLAPDEQRSWTVSTGLTFRVF
jgi:hypothetical protein